MMEVLELILNWEELDELSFFLATQREHLLIFCYHHYSIIPSFQMSIVNL